ncbi:MAG: ABC transporter permease [Gemmatimonadales bacterium]
MSGWLLRRSLQAVLTYFVAVSLIFFLMRLVPGDPLARLSDDRPMPPEAIAALRARYGLDQPATRQFLVFVTQLMRGDLGRSIERGGLPVTALVTERLPATLLLGGSALLLNLTLGLWLGAWQATHRGTRGERAVGAISLALYAMPSFWLGLVLAWAFGIKLRWLPVAFMTSPWLRPGASFAARAMDVLPHLVLPVLTLTLVTLGATARYQRGALTEALALVTVRAARSRGLSESVIRWRYAWRAAVGPMLALFGLWLPMLVAGSVFVETIFVWPGLGSLAADAIASRDYPVIMGTTLLVSAAVVGGNLLADVLHRWLDPRLRDA